MRKLTRFGYCNRCGECCEVLGGCLNYNHVKHVCRAYPYRPEVCRKYPSHPFCLKPSCTFAFADEETGEPITREKGTSYRALDEVC